MKFSSSIRNFLALLVALMLMGVAAYWYEYRADKQGSLSEGVKWHEDAEHGFAFAYPVGVDVNAREADHQATTYAGLDLNHFLSIRDIASEEKPNNLAFVYSASGLSVDAFIASLEKNVKGAKAESRTEESHGDFAMTKVVSTTEQPNILKTHYLFEAKGNLIIYSVFLGLEPRAEEVLNTLKRMD